MCDIYCCQNWIRFINVFLMMVVSSLTGFLYSVHQQETINNTTNPNHTYIYYIDYVWYILISFAIFGLMINLMSIGIELVRRRSLARIELDIDDDPYRESFISNVTKRTLSINDM